MPQFRLHYRKDGESRQLDLEHPQATLAPHEAALALLEHLRADAENSLALPPAEAPAEAILRQAEVHGLTDIQVEPLVS
ncbi:hypothetical protein [Pseudomonas rhizoryzae]|uniref:hypothetical protein n=1 Tax=Pseudomonas rhizoryzae TaxID=2571129 RepID=UPI00073724AF|nr:hypothetical protein [Pseudomonas rhizoryzae]KTT28190.1 hypothetical protein SB9_23530 [Pseudomonas psychrotolerans]KTT71261.1 hypothetical protein SB18R_22240 [Pseudomonas psychrotolerans]